MSWFKSKFDKLTREEVADAICSLEMESKDIEDGLIEKKRKIDELMEKGKKEKDRDIQLFYAKKINALKAERQEDVKRGMYLLYNIQLLEKLKRAIDDNQFFKNTAKVSLGNLLSDQKGLAKFLNKALNTRVRAEDVLTDADETFRMVEESYEQNDSIYGIGKEDDALLAMFETEDMVNSDTVEEAEEKKESEEATHE